MMMMMMMKALSLQKTATGIKVTNRGHQWMQDKWNVGKKWLS